MGWVRSEKILNISVVSFSNLSLSRLGDSPICYKTVKDYGVC